MQRVYGDARAARWISLALAGLLAMLLVVGILISDELYARLRSAPRPAEGIAEARGAPNASSDVPAGDPGAPERGLSSAASSPNASQPQLEIALPDLGRDRAIVAAAAPRADLDVTVAPPPDIDEPAVSPLPTETEAARSSPPEDRPARDIAGMPAPAAAPGLEAAEPVGTSSVPRAGGPPGEAVAAETAVGLPPSAPEPAASSSRSAASIAVPLPPGIDEPAIPATIELLRPAPVVGETREAGEAERAASAVAPALESSLLHTDLQPATGAAAERVGDEPGAGPSAVRPRRSAAAPKPASAAPPLPPVRPAALAPARGPLIDQSGVPAPGGRALAGLPPAKRERLAPTLAPRPPDASRTPPLTEGAGRTARPVLPPTPGRDPAPPPSERKRNVRAPSSGTPALPRELQPLLPSASRRGS